MLLLQKQAHQGPQKQGYIRCASSKTDGMGPTQHLASDTDAAQPLFCTS